MQSGSLIGVATRYLAGRNAMQTVYWRSINTGDGQKMIKVQKNLRYEKSANSQHRPEPTMCRI